MFACIYGRTFSKAEPDGGTQALVDLAFTFSPLIEQTTPDTMVLDVSGQDLLYGGSSNLPREQAGTANSSQALAHEIARRARQLNLEVNVSVAANPDAAIHSARAFSGVTIIPVGAELLQLGNLSLEMLDYALAGIEPARAEEIRETLALWGLHIFGDLAKLPQAGLAQRLGSEGVRLQNLAQGKTERQLVLVQPPIGFAQLLELEHPVTELEPLSFIFSRLLNQLCANLQSSALATNELHFKLTLEDKSEHVRTITLPVPMQNPKTLLRLVLFDVELQPPAAAIIAVHIIAEPVKPRVSQTGLFIPLAPEPEKLELTLARLVKLVGAENVGSPEILDTHRPDAFRINKFKLNYRARKNVGTGLPKSVKNTVMGFRVFRPPCWANVQTVRGRPVRISTDGSKIVSGKITCASGPWRASGDWWRADAWARDEWDIAIAGARLQSDEVLCRIYRDLQTEQWFVQGVYD
jgi:protein ImuB